MANTETERLTIAALFGQQQLEEQEKRHESSAILSTLSNRKGRERLKASPVTLREKLPSALQVGKRQVAGDKDRFLATANIIFGRDKAGRERLAKAEIHDQRVSELSENFTGFEEFLDAPTFTGFIEQAVTQTTKFIPNMGLSIASAVGTGGTSVVAKFGVNQASKAFAKRMAGNIAKKKMAGEAIDEAEEAVLDASYNYLRTFKRGAYTGAFGQEQVVGVGQAASEYQEAGIELTRDEALMSQVLGIPQALLGVLGEAYMANSLIKAALLRSPLIIAQRKAAKAAALTPREKRLLVVWDKYKKGSRLKESERKFLVGAGFENLGIGRFVRDVAVGVLRGGVTEGTTEYAQEEITIQQRFAIDPTYTAEEANLRRAEAAFGGFFAGGAMKGVGDAGASLISQARDWTTVRDIRSLENQAQDPLNSTLPETQETLDATADDLMRSDTGRKSMWVDANTTRGRETEALLIEKGTPFINAKRAEGVNKTLEHRREAQQKIVDDENVYYQLDLEAEKQIRKSMEESEVSASEIESYVESALGERRQKREAALEKLDDLVVRQEAFAETSKIFEKAPTVAQTDLQDLNEINKEIFTLKRQFDGKTLEGKALKDAVDRLAELQRKRDKLIAEILDTGRFIAIDRGAEKLDQLELFPSEIQYSERLRPYFSAKWVTEQDNFLVVPTEAGTLYTTDSIKAEQLSEMGPTPGVLATLLGMNVVSNPEHDLVIEVTNEKGTVIKQETTNEAEFDAALNNIQEFYPGILELGTAREAKHKWQKRALPSVIEERGFLGGDDFGLDIDYSEFTKTELQEMGLPFEEQEEQYTQIGEETEGELGTSIGIEDFVDARGIPVSPQKLEETTIIFNQRGNPWVRPSIASLLKRRVTWTEEIDPNTKKTTGLKPEGSDIERINLETNFINELDVIEATEWLEKIEGTGAFENETWTALSELSDSIIKKFLQLKGLNPGMNFEIQRSRGETALMDDTVPYFEIAKYGSEVTMNNVLVMAVMDAANAADAMNFSRKQQKRALVVHNWTATWKKGKEGRTNPRSVVMNTILMTALRKEISYLSKKQRQNLKVLSDKIEEIQAGRAPAEDIASLIEEMEKIQPILFEAKDAKALQTRLEGQSFWQQLAGEFAEVINVLENQEIQLYYKGNPVGKLIKDAALPEETVPYTWAEAAEFPIWRQGGEEYSLNALGAIRPRGIETAQTKIARAVKSVLYGIPQGELRYPMAGGTTTYTGPTRAQQQGGKTTTTTKVMTEPGRVEQRELPGPIQTTEIPARTVMEMELDPFLAQEEGAITTREIPGYSIYGAPGGQIYRTKTGARITTMGVFTPETTTTETTTTKEEGGQTILPGGLTYEVLPITFGEALNTATRELLKDTKMLEDLTLKQEMTFDEALREFSKFLPSAAPVNVAPIVIEKGRRPKGVLENRHIKETFSDAEIAQFALNDEIANRLYGHQRWKVLAEEGKPSGLENSSPRAKEVYERLFKVMGTATTFKDKVIKIKRTVPTKSFEKKPPLVEADTLIEFLKKVYSLPEMLEEIDPKTKKAQKRKMLDPKYEVPALSKILYSVIKFQYISNPAFKKALDDTAPFQIRFLYDKGLSREAEAAGHEIPTGLFGEPKLIEENRVQSVREQILVATYKILQNIRDEEGVLEILEDIMYENNILTPTEMQQAGMGMDRIYTPDHKEYEGRDEGFGATDEIEQMRKSKAREQAIAYGDQEGGFTDRVTMTRQEMEEGMGFLDTLQQIGPEDRKATVVTEGLTWSEATGEYFDKTFNSMETRYPKKRKDRSILDSIAKAVTNKLQLKGKFRVILADELGSINFNVPGDFVTKKGVSVSPTLHIKKVIRAMRELGEPGAVVTFGDTHVIILDPTAKGMPESKGARALQMLYVLGHEIAHPFLEQERAWFTRGKGLNFWEKFESDFAKAKEKVKGQEDHPYNRPGGIDEYYSDQFAIALLNLTNETEQNLIRKRLGIPKGEPKPKGIIDSYFTRLAKKIVAFFKELSAQVQGRFGKNAKSENFGDYIQEILASDRRAKEVNGTPSMSSVVSVMRFMGDAIPKMKKFIGENNSKKLEAELKKILTDLEEGKKNLLGKQRMHWGWKYLLKTADGYLRSIGAESIANIFYNPSQSTAHRGHLNARIWYVNRKLNKVWDLIEPEKPGNPTSEEIAAFVEVLKEAEENVDVSKLSPKAREVRAFLAEYNESIKELGLNSRNNFYPRQFAIEAIMSEADGLKRAMLVRILELQNPNATIILRRGKRKETIPVDFNRVVDGMLRQGERTDDDPHTAGPQSEDIAIGMAETRQQYFINIPNEYLRRGIDMETGNLLPKDNDAGLLLSPEIALRKYVEDMEKRLDYEKRAVVVPTDAEIQKYPWLKKGEVATGWKAMELLLQRIEDPVKQQGARMAVKNMLGKVGMNMKNWERQANSWMLTFNIMTYLTMATVASLPDLAGSILRSKDFSALGTFVQQWKTYFSDPAAAQAFARDLGLITFDSINTMYINAAELGFMTPASKKVSNFYFKTIGLETFTKFTRVFAAGMGEQFLLRTAQDKSDQATRWLKELHVTREDILYWNDPKKGNRSFDSEQGQRVQNALAQFVDESVIRPNAAERPVWASNPYFALVWQLKSFFYAYGKNILGGAIRESKNKYSETGGIPQAAIPLVLGAMPMLVLSMLGLEIREFVKYLVGGGDATKFRSDQMGAAEYFFEIVDRAGMLGAFTLLFPMFTAGKYGDEFWISPLGPTAGRIEDAIKGEIDIVDDWLPWLSAVN